MDLSVLFDAKANQFATARDINKKGFTDNSRYGLLATEILPMVLIAVGKGDIAKAAKATAPDKIAAAEKAAFDALKPEIAKIVMTRDGQIEFYDTLGISTLVDEIKKNGNVTAPQITVLRNFGFDSGIVLTGADTKTVKELTDALKIKDLEELKAYVIKTVNTLASTGGSALENRFWWKIIDPEKFPKSLDLFARSNIYISKAFQAPRSEVRFPPSAGIRSEVRSPSPLPVTGGSIL